MGTRNLWKKLGITGKESRTGKEFMEKTEEEIGNGNWVETEKTQHLQFLPQFLPIPFI